MTTWPAGGAHTTVSFAYDALGRRVAKTVNGVTERYVHDGDHVALDINGQSANSLRVEIPSSASWCLPFPSVSVSGFGALSPGFVDCKQSGGILTDRRLDLLCSSLLAAVVSGG